MRILVLGAYGLIGLPIAKALSAAGHDVVGLARSKARGKAHLLEAVWIGADIASLTEPEKWKSHLAGIEAVVNASGALQDGSRDTLQSLQSDAIRAVVAACESEGVDRFVQISAPGAMLDANTPFYRTKGEADAALSESKLKWTIFRPGVVISSSAYGGSSLLRMLAAFPVIQPLVMANAKIQTVSVDDVAHATVEAMNGSYIGADIDLVEDTPYSLEETVALVRSWLGFKPARAVVRFPRWVGFAVGRGADLLGWFGWRSPVRTSALKVLAENVTGDASSYRAHGGVYLKSLEATLAALPSTLQERVFARAHLVFPLLVFILSVFWIASGVIGIWQSKEAMAVLGDSLPPIAAKLAVFGGGVVDIAIGVGLMFRRWLRPACFAAVAVSLGYLAGGTVFTPHLWADPLGVFVKVFPGIGLALAVASIAEER